MYTIGPINYGLQVLEEWEWRTGASTTAWTCAAVGSVDAKEISSMLTSTYVLHEHVLLCISTTLLLLKIILKMGCTEYLSPISRSFYNWSPYFVSDEILERDSCRFFMQIVFFSFNKRALLPLLFCEFVFEVL